MESTSDDTLTVTMSRDDAYRVLRALDREHTALVAASRSARLGETVKALEDEAASARALRVRLAESATR